MGLIPFKIEHLANMDFKESVKSIASVEVLKEAMCKLVGDDTSATMVSEKDGTILGVLGAVNVMPSVCEVFILATKQQGDHPIEFAKSVKKKLYELKTKYRRIQAIASDDKFHTRWLSWLGFEREGVMKKYGVNGENLVMWGLI